MAGDGGALSVVRVGLGYDIHPLVDGRPLVLGGVTIPFSRGLEGHSDADALAHAICDALLGAAGLKDMGNYYPDTDPAFHNIRSLELLRDVGKKVAGQGFRLVNIDTVILAELPKMAPHIPQMKAHVAEVLGVDSAIIGIKATRAEGLGPIGRGEGVAVHAVCLLENAETPR